MIRKSDAQRLLVALYTAEFVLWVLVYEYNYICSFFYMSILYMKNNRILIQILVDHTNI